MKEKQLPMTNIAFQLWSDVVHWSENADTRQLSYSLETLKFFLGRNKIVWWKICTIYVRNKNNKTTLLQGSVKLDPHDVTKV